MKASAGQVIGSIATAGTPWARSSIVNTCRYWNVSSNHSRPPPDCGMHLGDAPTVHCGQCGERVVEALAAQLPPGAQVIGRPGHDLRPDGQLHLVRDEPLLGLNSHDRLVQAGTMQRNVWMEARAERGASRAVVARHRSDAEPVIRVQRIGDLDAHLERPTRLRRDVEGQRHGGGVDRFRHPANRPAESVNGVAGGHLVDRHLVLLTEECVMATAHPVRPGHEYRSGALRRQLVLAVGGKHVDASVRVTANPAPDLDDGRLVVARTDRELLPGERH